VRALAAALRGDDSAAREAAAWRLLQKGPGVFLPAMLAAARDRRAGVRALACQRLVNAWADPRDVAPALAAAADDGTDMVRLEATRALGRLPALASSPNRSPTGRPGRLAPATRAKCIGAMRRLLRDCSSAVRAEAAGALAEFGADPAAVADLAAAAGDPDRAVRFAAARALLRVNGSGDRVAAEALVGLVADPRPARDRIDVVALRDASDEARGRAYAALSDLLSRADPSVRPEVIFCLMADGDRARVALPSLEALLDDRDPDVRALAGNAIAFVDPGNNTRAAALLARTATDVRVRLGTRWEAVDFLRVADWAALAVVTSVLYRQLEDDIADVRRAARSLLSVAEEPPAGRRTRSGEVTAGTTPG
jgi:HEAT repeat protein